MDNETAQWFAGLLVQASTQLDHQPGLTIEVLEKPEYWLQVIFETDDDTKQITGFLLNFPFRESVTEPLELITTKGIVLPPDTRSLKYEPGGFASIWIRADIPLVALALLAGDLLAKVMGAPEEAEFEVQIEYGF